MFGQVIRALLFLCCIALAFYLIVWVLEQLGIRLPPMVEKILVVMLVLVAILVLYNLFAPWLGGINWWGRGPGPSIVLVFALAAALAACAPPADRRACDVLVNPLACAT
ncbi:MAG TPA: hypothetical protein VNN79_11195 [Actinomycetota bacterium]|nr:hypothetical protein [Actinomycetota bacterium]